MSDAFFPSLDEILEELEGLERNDFPPWWDTAYEQLRDVFLDPLPIPQPQIPPDPGTTDPPPGEEPRDPEDPGQDDEERDDDRRDDQDDDEQEEEDDDSWLVDLFKFIWGWLFDWLSGEPCIDIPIDYRVYEWSKEEEDEGEEKEAKYLTETITFAPPVPWAARVGDPVLHGGGSAPGPGSPNVFIGGKPALRASDSHVCPLTDPVPHVGGTFMPTDSSVLINGLPALRVGDSAFEPAAGMNPVIVGCPTVEIGPVPPPVVCQVQTPLRRPDVPLLPYMQWDEGYIGEVKGTLSIGLSLVGPVVKFEGTLTSAYLYSEWQQEWEYSLGDPDFDGKEEFLNREAHYETETTVGKFDVDAAYYPLAEFGWWDTSNPVTKRETKKIYDETRIVDEDGNDEGVFEDEDEDGDDGPEPEPEQPKEQPGA